MGQKLQISANIQINVLRKLSTLRDEICIFYNSKHLPNQWNEILFFQEIEKYLRKD